MVALQEKGNMQQKEFEITKDYFIEICILLGGIIMEKIRTFVPFIL